MNKTFPYPGLRPFERDETDIFFGREDHTDQLLEKLGQNRFLAVVGPSGCGKSSLVRTGLLAGLEGGLLTSAGIYWHIAEMRPGNHPFAHLAEALLADSALGDEYINHFTHKPEALASLQATLRCGPLSLCELWREAQFDTDTRLLLLVDQFEELFRYYQQGEVEETAAFVALLLASYQNPNIYVIITMRSDFIGDCAAFYGLPEAVNAGLYLTPRLTREQLSEAIALPATVFGGTVEEGLLNRLLNDAGNDPDQLPIIQHALMRMWQHAAGAEEGVLTLAHYEQIGAFKKALSNHADKAYGELTGAQQKIAEILFRNLSERDSNKRDTRRPTELREIARLAEVEWQAVVPVVEVFRKQGRHFLVPPVGQDLAPDTVLDISHESLIRQWQRMPQWLNQEAESAVLYQRVEETAQRWQDGKAALLRSPELEHILAWRTQAQPTQAWAERYGQHFALAMDFLEDSDQAQHQEAKAIQKRRRVTLASMAGGLIIAIILTLISVFFGLDASQQRQKAEASLVKAEASQAKAEAQKKEALDQKEKAEKQKREAQRNQSFALSALSEFEREKGNLTNAMLLALEGLPKNLSEPEKPYVSANENQLSQAVFKSSENYLERFVMDGDNSIHHVAFSPDGALIALADSGGAVHLWEATSAQRLHTLIGHTNKVNHVVFSPDGGRLATASDDNTARLWEVKSGKLIQTLRGHENTVLHAAFSPDGGRLATASSDQTARLWAVPSGKLIQTLRGHESSVWHAAFSPDGGRLATASRDKTARLWPVLSTQKLIDEATKRVPRCLTPKQREEFFLSDDPSWQLIENGEQLAKTGKIQAAIDAFQGAQLQAPCFKFDPSDKARRIAAKAYLEKGKALAQQGKIQDAVVKFTEATTVDSRFKLDKPENYAIALAQQAAQNIIENGTELAREGLLEEATTQFKKALAIDTHLNFDPANKAQGIAWLKQGEELAQAGQLEDAITKFKAAQALDSTLTFEPEIKAKKLFATALVKQGQQLAKKGQIEKAIAHYQQAQQVDANLEISDWQWNSLCRYGSVYGHAAKVMAACEKAVELSPETASIRDSRALARAFTGNIQGAIEDFQFAIETSDDDDWKSKRQAWLEALKKGDNPFTEDVLEGLR